MTADFHTERRRRQLYGRRKGPKLSARQQRLLDGLLPKLALSLEPRADPKTYFGHVNDVWLEVGFGAGEHLLWQAERHPDIGMIGAEPYVAGMARLLAKVEQAGLSNLRLYMGDARDILETLPEASLGRVFLLFPDPWPKTRHHKRRFIQTETLNTLGRVMKPGAELRFASDDAGYFAWTLERIVHHPLFSWLADSAADWRTRPDDWPQTRYAAKALHGKPAYLRAVRR